MNFILFLKIKLIHNSRESLQDQINMHRDENLLDIEHSCVRNRTHKVSKRKLSSEVINLHDGINNIIKKKAFEPNDIETIKKKSDKIQRSLYDIKKDSWYFAENIMEASDKLLGRLLTNKQDVNFVKIKNLKSLLENEASSVKVNLQTEFKLTILRQEVLPISKNRIIKIYFSTLRTLNFELFDAKTGKCLKSLKAFEHLSSFPVSAGYGELFVCSFAARNTDHPHSDTNTNYIRLYDMDFNVIKSIQRQTSIESCFMNDKYVIIHYSHLAESCCEVYDFTLTQVSSFGQQSNTTAPFYLEKSNLSMRQQMNLNFRINPKLFGFTEEYIYLWNYHKVFIMCRKSGIIVKSMKLHGSRPYFLLDSQKNIIQINNLAKRISLYSHDFELIIENIYSDNLDNVYLNRNDQMIFVDMEKKMVVYI